MLLTPRPAYAINCLGRWGDGGFQIFVEAEEEFRDILEAVGRSHDVAACIAVQSPAEVLMLPGVFFTELVNDEGFDRYTRHVLDVMRS